MPFVLDISLLFGVDSILFGCFMNQIVWDGSCLQENVCFEQEHNSFGRRYFLELRVQNRVAGEQVIIVIIVTIAVILVIVIIVFILIIAVIGRFALISVLQTTFGRTHTLPFLKRLMIWEINNHQFRPAMRAGWLAYIKLSEWRQRTAIRMDWLRTAWWHARCRAWTQTLLAWQQLNHQAKHKQQQQQQCLLAMPLWVLHLEKENCSYQMTKPDYDLLLLPACSSCFLPDLRNEYALESLFRVLK
jgi:hypothetical protein